MISSLNTFTLEVSERTLSATKNLATGRCRRLLTFRSRCKFVRLVRKGFVTIARIRIHRTLSKLLQHLGQVAQVSGINFFFF